MKKYRMNDVDKTELDENFINSVTDIHMSETTLGFMVTVTRYIIQIRSKGYACIALEYLFECDRDRDYEALKEICNYEVINILDICHKKGR